MYTDYLTDENPDMFLLLPTNKEESKFILSSLDINKYTGPYSIPSKVLNMLKITFLNSLLNYLTFLSQQALSQLF